MPHLLFHHRGVYLPTPTLRHSFSFKRPKEARSDGSFCARSTVHFAPQYRSQSIHMGVVVLLHVLLSKMVAWYVFLADISRTTLIARLLYSLSRARARWCEFSAHRLASTSRSSLNFPPTSAATSTLKHVFPASYPTCRYQQIPGLISKILVMSLRSEYTGLSISSLHTQTHTTSHSFYSRFAGSSQLSEHGTIIRSLPMLPNTPSVVSYALPVELAYEHASWPRDLYIG